MKVSVLRQVSIIAFSSMLFLLIFTLAGCWDRQEIQDIALVTGVGIGHNKNGIELSVEIILPEAGGETGGKSDRRTTYVESATGLTVHDAISKLQQKVPRYLFFGQSGALVIGENLAKERGIRFTADFFSRHPETRLRASVFVTKQDPKEILAAISHLENSATETLMELSQFQIGLDVSIKDLLNMLETGDAALPLVETLPGKENTQTDIQITGTAVFKKDKMIGSIDMEVTRGVLWIRDEIEIATITIKPEKGEGLLSSEIIRSTVELTPHIENDKWSVKMKAISEDEIMQNASNVDLNNPELVLMLERQLAQVIEERVLLALEVVQKELKADILGFSELFHRKYPKQWKEAKDRWDEVFPEIEVDVEVRAVIYRPGLSTQPQGIPNGEVKEE